MFDKQEQCGGKGNLFLLGLCLFAASLFSIFERRKRSKERWSLSNQRKNATQMMKKFIQMATMLEFMVAVMKK